MLRLAQKTFLAAAFCLGFLTEARAGVIEVAPVVVQINGNETTTTLTLTNRSDETSSVQIRPYEWTQSTGDDDLKPTTQIIVSPPIFDLPPSQSQIVRIVRRSPAAATELSYRLIIDELPQTAKDNQVRFNLRISMPVFVDSAQSNVKPPLEWKLRKTDTESQIVVSNRGSRRVRILNPIFTSAQGSTIEVQAPGNPYVLAGAERVWKLKNPADANDLKLVADSDFGPVTESIRF